jgi:hypothetical protein
MTLSWPKSFNARANHPQQLKISQQSLAILRRPSSRKWRNSGEASGYARYLIA